MADVKKVVSISEEFDKEKYFQMLIDAIHFTVEDIKYLYHLID